MAKMRVQDYATPYRIVDGRNFRLGDFDPAETRWVKSKRAAGELLKQGLDVLRDLQDMLYAQDRWGVLLIFQAMDAAGKDSTIKHVMAGVNPQSSQVFSFKAPSQEELDHDFMWRTSCRLPERGRIGIFNRSYYEETLVVRVHREYLEAQKLPPALVTENIWQERFDDINAFERYISRNGFVVRKFFLNVSREEQRRRFLSRIDEPAKNWKFSMGDVEERKHWDEYMAAYEDTIRNTASGHAPWYVVPADHKWFTRLVVAAAIVDALQGLDLHFPKLDERKLEELREARRTLEAQRNSPAPAGKKR